MGKSTWTKDADGNYVRWNEPPHYVDGVLNLLLDGEQRASRIELRKRRDEYLRLRWRAMTGKKRKPIARR